MESPRDSPPWSLGGPRAVYHILPCASGAISISLRESGFSGHPTGAPAPCPRGGPWGPHSSLFGPKNPPWSPLILDPKKGSKKGLFWGSAVQSRKGVGGLRPLT